MDKQFGNIYFNFTKHLPHDLIKHSSHFFPQLPMFDTKFEVDFHDK